MKVNGHETTTQREDQSLTLVQVLNVASSGYKDDFLKKYYHEETGQANEAGSGDTLAEFIVLEIRDTFDANLPKTEQLTEACRVLRRAISNVESVIEALE